jgi:hypothetical protein
LEHTLETCVYSHYNTCNIPLKHLKDLKHTLLTNGFHTSSVRCNTEQGNGRFQQAGSCGRWPSLQRLATLGPGLGPANDNHLPWPPSHMRRAVPVRLRGYCWRARASRATKEEEVVMEGDQQRTRKASTVPPATNAPR